MFLTVVPCYNVGQLQTDGGNGISCGQQSKDAETRATVLAEFSSMVANTQHYIIQVLQRSIKVAIFFQVHCIININKY